MRGILLLGLWFLVLTSFGYCEESGLRVITKYVKKTLHAATSHPITVPIDKGTFQSVAMSLSSTQTINATISISAGFKPSSGDYVFYPLEDFTGQPYAGASPITTIFSMSIPVCPVIKVTIQNLSATGALAINHFFLSDS
jgi:hypothetical protein